MIVEDFDIIKEEYHEKEEKCSNKIRVCVAASCVSSGSEQLKEKLDEIIKERGLEEDCAIKPVGCMGLCSSGPLVEDVKNKVFYGNVNEEHGQRIVNSVYDGVDDELKIDTNIPFFTRQFKIVLENSGIINPEDIGEYIAHDGYHALVETISNNSPDEVIEEIKKSGLRGRGGGGYPTGLKWSTVAKTISDKKYIICNADEGDPGAFMDRSVLESDPHRVIEGMALAAYAVGANEGFIYVRAEYPLAIARLKKAIKQAERSEFLGNKVANTNFSFNLSIRLGAGAYVCGEETALIASIEGKRGTPRPRPPFPAEYGLWGKPTLINNVETYANIPAIMRKGGDWYSSIGTEGSKGTKVFALAGQIKNTGLIEVPMGVSLREIIFEIGGGIPNDGKFKAVQTGGPSGGCIPEEHLDLPVDYESLRKVGSMMGSGGMIIMNESSSMVDVARFFMDFSKSESCGKCVPCRVGTTQVYNILERFLKDEANSHDLETLEELCELMQNTSLCGLGISAPNPVISTLRYFREEYLEHILTKNVAG